VAVKLVHEFGDVWGNPLVFGCCTSVMDTAIVFNPCVFAEGMRKAVDTLVVFPTPTIFSNEVVPSVSHVFRDFSTKPGVISREFGFDNLIYEMHR
jgi:hypothetical protein